MALYYSMGITQFVSGVNGVKSTANLQMLLGNVGVAGGGVNPLRGQNNNQGACDMGGLPMSILHTSRLQLKKANQNLKWPGAHQIFH